MRRTFALLLTLAASGPRPAPAEAPPSGGPTAIALRPAAEPSPALKYRLVPARQALVPGNAVVYYHRALLMYETNRNGVDEQAKARPGGRGRAMSIDQQVADWTYMPIAQIPRDEARAAIQPFANALAEVDLGVKRLDADWGFDRRPEGVNLLLPEIQGIRSVARLISLQARLAILDGDFDRALERVETGFALARHVARGPIVIQALVGVAISNEMTLCLQPLIQAPGAPSLYWALANRPRPFIDMRDSFDAEQEMLEAELPGLRELGAGIWGQDQARRFVDELQRKLVNLVSPSMPGASLLFGNSGMISGRASTTIRQLGVAAAAASVYPEARRAMLAAGSPEARVDAMPVIQVACWYSYREYRRASDDLSKGLALPYWQAIALPRPAGFESVEAKVSNPLLATFSTLSSELRPARLAQLRLDRQLDALQCIEAIRLDASAHGGKLPAGLESIVAFPCPVDPTSGKAFAYEVEGDSATLNAPIPPGAPDHPAYLIRFALKPAR